ncbi:MAG: HAD hydrolase-like protein [Thermodesulfobacteriota bacterium]
MRFAAVIFDLDGTLLDSLEDLADSVNAVLAERGMPVHPVAAFRRFVGDGVVNLVRRAAPAGLSDAELQDLVRAGRAEYGRRWDAKSRPYPGVPAMLDALAGAGVRLALLSNKPDDFTRRIAGRFYAAWPLDPARGARDGAPLKPDPAAALELAREMGFAPGEILFAGDSDVDVRTARNAGMFAAGVLWGFRGADELAAAGADRLFAGPEELASFILGD